MFSHKKGRENLYDPRFLSTLYILPTTRLSAGTTIKATIIVVKITTTSLIQTVTWIRALFIIWKMILSNNYDSEMIFLCGKSDFLKLEHWFWTQKSA